MADASMAEESQRVEEVWDHTFRRKMIKLAESDQYTFRPDPNSKVVADMCKIVGFRRPPVRGEALYVKKDCDVRSSPSAIMFCLKAIVVAEEEATLDASQ